MSLNKIRWEALEYVGVSGMRITNYIKKKYDIEIKENNFNKIIDIINNKYDNIDQEEALFELEDSAYKKINIFYLKEKDCEELRNPMFREHFILKNRLKNIIDAKKVNDLDEVLFPAYIHFSDRYVIIKMSQIRSCIVNNVDEDNVTTSKNKKYYHCTKFVIDLEKNLVFLFYNDIINQEEDINSKNKAITEKKRAFYSLFAEGNQYTLLKMGIDIYLKKYVEKSIKNLEENTSDECNNSIIVIETSDPCETKDNLRSSKKDGKHNNYRLQAIKYALKEEAHTIKMMECEINNMWFQFKSSGEIITSDPYLNREVIKDVCKKVFPDYGLSQETISATS